MRPIACLISLLFLGVAGVRAEADVNTQELARIAQVLSQQDNAWDDLDVRYNCDWWERGEDGEFHFGHRREHHWLITQQGWEQFSIKYPPRDGIDAYVETLSYNGEYFMTRSLQGEGSGSVGHAWNRMINHPDHIKTLGLAVSGLELNQPLSVQGFLTSKKAGVTIKRVEDGMTVVSGEDPWADEYRIHLWLDPRVGYRPAKIEVTDKEGLHTSLDHLGYKKLTGVRGESWFPIRGTWNCVESKKRTVTGQYRYEVTEVQVDRKPGRDVFTLTYPKGALILNNDTRESSYLRTASTVADIPHMSGKLMTLEEHDMALQEPQSLSKPWLWGIIIAVNAAVAMLALAVWLRRIIASRLVGPSA